MLIANHGHPDTWITGKFVREILSYIDNPDITVLDGTWLDNLKPSAMHPPVHTAHLVVAFFLDPAEPIFAQRKWSRIKQRLGHIATYDRITLLDHLSYDYCWQSHQAHNFFADLEGKDFPLDFRYYFLSYNRKPHDHRVALVNSYRSCGIMDCGIVTLGTDRNNTELLTVPGNAAIPDIANNRDFGIPNDIDSLGDLEIWKQCFVNIISETTTDFWFSDKSYKPLVGKRPFIIDTNHDCYAKLRDWGFKTFEDYWDETLPTADILVQLCQMTEKEIVDMNKDMQPILEHNHQWFFGEYKKYNLAQLDKIKLELASG